MSFTNAQLAAKMADLITYWQSFNKEYAGWLAGAAGGGDNSDGKYPLTDWFGTAYLVASPAQLQFDVDTLLAGAGGYADQVAADAAAVNAQVAVATSKSDLAEAARQAAVAALAEAQLAEASAADSRVTAVAQANLAKTRADSAAASEVNVSTMEANVIDLAAQVSTHRDEVLAVDLNDYALLTDLNPYAKTADLAPYALTSDVATLDGSGKINTQFLPSLIITDTFAVSSQAAMLALTAQRGDVAIRSDINTTYILKADDASVLANWEKVLTPADGIQAVNGKTSSTVTLDYGDFAGAQSITLQAGAKITSAVGFWAPNNQGLVGYTAANTTSYSIARITTNNQVQLGNSSLQGVVYSNDAPQWWDGTTTRTLIHTGGGQNSGGINFTSSVSMANNFGYYGKKADGSWTLVGMVDSSNRTRFGNSALQTRIDSLAAPQFHNGTATYDLIHAGGGQTIAGTTTITKLVLPPLGDVNLTTSNVPLMIGSQAANNIIFDDNEIQARNNGAKATLHLNLEGGSVNIGSDGIISSGPITTSGELRTNSLINLNNYAMLASYSDANGQFLRIRANNGTWASPYSELLIGNDGTFRFDGKDILRSTTGQTAPDLNITNYLKFGPGVPANDDAHIEWLGASNAGFLRISTSDDNGAEYVEFGDYDSVNRGGAFTRWAEFKRGSVTLDGTLNVLGTAVSATNATLNAQHVSASGYLNASEQINCYRYGNTHIGYASGAANTSSNYLSHGSSGAFYVRVYDGSSYNNALTVSGAGNTSLSGSLSLLDTKSINIGAGGDLQLQHSGTHSYIDNYTGSMYLRQLDSAQNLALQVRDTGGTARTVAQGQGNTASPYFRTFYGTSEKTRTISSGLQVYGTLAADTAVSAPTITENGVNLSAKYLGISSKAADSELLDGKDSGYFIYGNALTGTTILTNGTLNVSPLKCGFYEGQNITGAPDTNWWNILNAENAAGNGYGWSLASSANDGNALKFRTKVAGTYSSWRDVWHSGNVVAKGSIPAANNSSTAGTGFGGFRYTISGSTLNLFTT